MRTARGRSGTIALSGFLELHDPNRLIPFPIVQDQTRKRRLTGADFDPIGLGDPFAFPFQSIESVLPLGGDRLLVLNDNNYPFSAGRRPGVPDDTEAIVIQVPALPDAASRSGRGRGGRVLMADRRQWTAAARTSLARIQGSGLPLRSPPPDGSARDRGRDDRAARPVRRLLQQTPAPRPSASETLRRAKQDRHAVSSAMSTRRERQEGARRAGLGRAAGARKEADRAKAARVDYLEVVP